MHLTIVYTGRQAARFSGQVSS